MENARPESRIGRIARIDSSFPNCATDSTTSHLMLQMQNDSSQRLQQFLLIEMKTDIARPLELLVVRSDVLTM